MTQPDQDAERHYRYQERIGILCGTDKPTEEQERMARGEAEEIVKQLRSCSTNE